MTNVAEKGMDQFLFSVHGVSVSYSTMSPLLADPVNEFLKHFQHDSHEQSVALKLCFRAVEERGNIPWIKSSSAHLLSSGTGESVGDRRETGLPYDVIQDDGRLIADFHDVGVLIMDGGRGPG